MGTITILNSFDLAPLGSIEITDVSIYQKINDKYTLDFTAYEQPFIDLLASGIYLEIFIKKENNQDVYDTFRINEMRHNPVEGRYDVSCEHISYELNLFTRTDETGQEEFSYSGSVGDIVTQILGDGSRFSFIPSDDIQGNFEFTTNTVGRRSRIIEFCLQNGFEVFWRNFNVAIQIRRGIDDGLIIELGSNLRGLEINTTFNFDQTTTTTFDVDFVDLNAVLDENGQPLLPGSFDMGDYVTVRYKEDSYYQRVIAVRYNPFIRALPTVELENPNRDIVEVIANNSAPRPTNNDSGGGDVNSLNIIRFTGSGERSSNGFFPIEFQDLITNRFRNQGEDYLSYSGSGFRSNGNGFASVTISSVNVQERVAKGLTPNDVYLKSNPYYIQSGAEQLIRPPVYYRPRGYRLVDSSDDFFDLYEINFGTEIYDFILTP